MIVVERPPPPGVPVPRGRFWDSGAKNLAELPAGVLRNAESLGALVDRCAELIGLASLPELGKTVGDARRAAAVGARAGLGLYTAAGLAPGAPFTLTLPGLGAHELRGTGPSSMAGAARYATAFALALIARDGKALAGLTAFDRELLRASATTSPEPYHVLADCLACCWLRDPRLGDRLDALEELAGARARAGSTRPELLATLGTAGDLIRRTVWRDERYQDAVVAAVEAHRAWFTREELSTYAEGFVALRVLGLVCLGHDRGLPLAVRSPYLPPGLVDPTLPDDAPLA